MDDSRGREREFTRSGSGRDAGAYFGESCQLIRQQPYEVQALEQLQVNELAFGSYEVERLDVVPLLFQTGYLTIKGYDPQRRLSCRGTGARSAEQPGNCRPGEPPVKVVANAPPLIALSLIDYLDLLPRLFAEVIIPQAIYEEAVVHGRAGVRGVLYRRHVSVPGKKE